MQERTYMIDKMMRGSFPDFIDVLAAKEPEVFRAQAEHALMPEGLPSENWERPLAERIGEALESLACRLQIERWQPGKASGAH